MWKVFSRCEGFRVIFGGRDMLLKSLEYVRWPTSATAKLTFPRQNLLFHGKTYFSTAKLTFPRQNLLFHGKTYFSTAKLTFPRQNLLFHPELPVCLCLCFPALEIREFSAEQYGGWRRRLCVSNPCIV